MNDWQKAMGTLRRRGSDADKAALLRRLREAPAETTFAGRVSVLWERLWPRLRLPVYGATLGLSLAAVVGIGIFYTQSPIAAPEIDDLEFAGSSAVVIESTSDPATLIWLSDSDEDEEEDNDDDEESEGEEL